MNIFYLPGPDFLGIFVAWGMGVLILLCLWRKLSWPKTTTASARMLSNPYKIAYLQEGRSETLALATISLVDQGLLQAQYPRDPNTDYIATRNKAELKYPLEQAVLEAFETPKPIIRDWYHPTVNRILADDEYDLMERGLLTSKQMRQRHSRASILASLAIVLPAAIKIFIALNHGHNNIIFLVLLSCLFTALTLINRFRRITPAGQRLLRDLRKLMPANQQQVATLAGNGKTQELILMGSLWGIGLLALPQFPFVTSLLPANSSNDFSSGSSDSSSSNSSSCSSSSSGCGGCGGGGD